MPRTVFARDDVRALVQCRTPRIGARLRRRRLRAATGALLTAAADPLSLTLLKPPSGEPISASDPATLGVRSSSGTPRQFLAVRDTKYMRQMPGRVIGVSKDAQNNRALRMALATREQHIRRDKATSNICTARRFSPTSRRPTACTTARVPTSRRTFAVSRLASPRPRRQQRRFRTTLTPSVSVRTLTTPFDAFSKEPASTSARSTTERYRSRSTDVDRRTLEP